MKKHLFAAAMALVMGVGSAQSLFLDHPTYRGAFAPAPTPAWTDGWTNWDPQNAVYPPNTMTISTVSGTNNAVPTITSNTTWQSTDVVYLNGPVFVKNATLTIMPGCVVKGAPGNGTGLFICTGAQLIANGTAQQPIVFTSNSAPGFRNLGDWGGVILLGRSSCNAPASNTANVVGNAPLPLAGTNYIEGMPSTSLTLYGGGSTPCDDDNSGSMMYCRIEYAGYVYAPNKEINSLTFGAVGYGTTIDYIQCSYGNDDAYEWFGGSVHCKHIIAYGCIDDDFDTDNGFHGMVQYGLGIRRPDIYDPTWNVTGGSTSEGFESDNDPEDLTIAGYSAGQPHAQTAAIFANMTDIGPRTFASVLSLSVGAGFHDGAHIRRNSSLRVVNSIIVDHARDGAYIDGVHAGDNAQNGCLLYKNNIVAGYGEKAIRTNTTDLTNPTQWIGQASDTLVLSTTIAGGTVSKFMTNPYVAFAGGTTIPDFRPIGTATAGADWTNVHIASEDVNYPCDQTTFSSLSAFVATCNIIIPASIKGNTGNIARLSMYPNPSNADGVTLTFDAQNASTLDVLVSDITGKIVSAPVQNQNMSAGENKIAISTKELNNGIYFVTLKTPNGKETVKLIVNK